MLPARFSHRRSRRPRRRFQDVNPPRPAPAGPAAVWPGCDDVPSAPVRPQIPDYELLRLVGRGSYGDVWLARGLTGIFRAIKVVWRERFTDAGPFEREFKGLAEFAAISLGESIQLALLHAGRNEDAGFFYYVMELADDIVRGRDIDPATYVPLTLSELRARRGRVPAEACVTFGVELAQVLASLHARGLVHRDIKPSNVILVQGKPKLADIGLISPVDSARTFVGTEGFVPPEGPGTRAADVFALGKVLYELATGLDRHDFPQLPPGIARLPDAAVLMRLNEVVLRACDPLPEKRLRDGGELLAELSAVRAGKAVRRGWRYPISAAAGIAACLAVAVVWWNREHGAREPAAVHAPAGSAAPGPKAAAAPVPGDEKSLIVLPLENLSPNPADAFFTDGMHAEIIVTLSRLADLRVISRATAQTLKGQSIPLPEVGRRFNAANVLAGSVHRAGAHVRVRLDLRRASDEALLWQNTFDRVLQPGFALQDEIVADIARVLQARASTGWYAGAHFMTKHPEAYLLFLQAREIPFAQGTSRAAMAEQVRLAEAALRIDPEFMSAASLLASAYVYYWSTEPDGAKRTEIAANARRWAEKASQLVPGGAGDGALAVYYGMLERDHARALSFALNEVRALPNDPNGHNRLASSLSAYGRVGEALASHERALALDPLNVRVLHNRIGLFARLRRVPEFEAAVARSLAFGGRNVDRAQIADLRFRLTGKLPESLDETLFGFLPGRPLMLWYGRRFQDVLVIAEGEVKALSQHPPRGQLYFLLGQARALRWLGREVDAAAVGREMLAHAERQPAVDRVDREIFARMRMWGLACSGRGDEAVVAGRVLVEAAAAPARTSERWVLEEELAQVYAWLGRGEECAEVLARLLKAPAWVTLPYLELAPEWDAVRDHPAFRALLNDPKNNAPL